ncbi:MAG: glycosyltransferase family 4 protein [Tahibacter sp.]
MKAILFANTDWYLYNFRLSLAVALQRQGVEVLLLSPPGDYGEKLQALGLRWIAVPLQRRSLGPLRELRVVWWLWRLFRHEHPDLVHGFTIKCAVYASLAAWLAGVKASVNAVTGMGYVFTSTDRRARLLRPLVRGVMRIAFHGRRKRLILQNAADVTWFTEQGLADPDSVRLIASSGVDVSRFVPRLHDSSPLAPLRVILAARILWDKGIGEFIAAARQLRAEGRHIHFHVAGMPDSGNPSSVPRSVIEAWVEEGTIEWLGHVDDMPTLFASADVVVLPSYREGCPKSLIEAAACALPLITTDVPGCNDVVTHNVNGLLVPVRDATALAQAIARLADDRPFARRLGLAAREHALHAYSEPVVLARTLDVYRELIPGFGTRDAERC